MEFVATWAPGTSRGEMGLGPQRYSESLAVAVATFDPRSPDVQPAVEGVVDVSAAAALCVKSLRRASSYSGVVIHPAERVPWRAWTPRTSGGKRRSRTSCSSYVVANTGRIESSKLSSMPPPTESADGTAEPVLISDGKRHWGVGGRSGGRPPGASGAPGVVIMGEFKFAPCQFEELLALTVSVVEQEAEELPSEEQLANPQLRHVLSG